MIRVFTKNYVWTDYNFNLWIWNNGIEIQKFILYYMIVRRINQIIVMSQLLQMTDYLPLKYGMSMYQSMVMHYRTFEQKGQGIQEWTK